MAETSMSSMRRAMDMGEKLGLKNAELAKFIDENEPKFAAEIEREKRRMEREAKKEAEDRQLQMHMKKMEIDSQKQARELEMQREIEEKRLTHELEMKKLEVESIRMDDSKNESTGLERVSNKHIPKLPVFDEKTDEMDSYLQRFEWIAKNYQWDKAEWSFHLSQYLKGKATETYTRMAAENRKDYDQVKEALLKRYNFTEEGYRKRFRKSKAEPDEAPQQFLVRLSTYIDKWVELSNCKDLKELNLREQFIAACPTDLAVHLKEMKFDSCDELAEAADRYLTAHGRKMSFMRKTTPNETTITGHSYNKKGHIAN
ncbi:microfibrillar-associated protein 1-like [Watersipora subatra]|uniref:microfibrillar-associated protein 1-like n=1 Tax=Watersipora subatra TaxID=2589382 RepID=UPI00355BA7BF